MPSDDFRLQQHDYVEGETFEYFYDSTEATYATEQVRDGRVPRITDLQKIDDFRTGVRISIVGDGDKLVKRLELLAPKFRELTSEYVAKGAGPISFRPIQDRVPTFPEQFDHTYDLGTDGQVALTLNKVFADYADPLLHKIVDVFTWPAITENLPKQFSIGEVRIAPGRDMKFGGYAYHDHNRVQLFDRVDLIDGVHHAYIKVQVPGNHMDVRGMDNNYKLAFHVPLEGAAVGLVSRGELQELIFGGGPGEAPVTATVRQVSMTMQTPTMRSAVDAFS